MIHVNNTNPPRLERLPMTGTLSLHFFSLFLYPKTRLHCVVFSPWINPHSFFFFFFFSLRVWIFFLCYCVQKHTAFSAIHCNHYASCVRDRMKGRCTCTKLSQAMPVFFSLLKKVLCVTLQSNTQTEPVKEPLRIHCNLH